MKRTPLYDAHVAARAKLVEFAGWEMPIRYSGVVDEYRAVRGAAGLFDVSHMGRIVVRGSKAADFLQHVATNDVSVLHPLQSHYSMVCNPEGGIKDDVFIYRTAGDEFLLCVNASNRDKLVGWCHDQARAFDGVQIEDRSEALAQLALQGPRSSDLLAEAGVPHITSVKPRHCLQASLDRIPLLIARTGYTGEVGYELYLPSSRALGIWDRLMVVGKELGLKPAGLGARDLLRLDMAYLLYGNDISEETTPLEAGAGRVVTFDKGAFVGRDALLRQRDSGLTRRLVAFELLEKAVPRHGCTVIRRRDGEERIGEVTSGNLSPMLQTGIGLAYVPPADSAAGTSVAIEIRGRLVPARIVIPPFYKRHGTP